MLKEKIIRAKVEVINSLSVYQLGVLLKLVALALASPRLGFVYSDDYQPLNISELCRIFHVRRGPLSRALEFLQQKGFIFFTDEGILLHERENWRDPTLVRQREYMRQRRRKLS